MTLFQMLPLLVLAQPHADFPAQLQSQALQATVKITARGEGTVAAGTGTIVGLDKSRRHILIVTAQHCVDTVARDEYQVLFHPFSADAPSASDVKVLCSITPTDLALIQVTAPPRLPGLLPICHPSAVPSGEFPVLTIGCSHGADPTIQPATVLGHAKVELQAGVGRYWNVTPRPVPGRSGGPMISEAGTLVGVCSARDDRVGYYCHATELHKLLDAGNFGWLYGASKASRQIRYAASVQSVKATWLHPERWQATVEILLQLDVQDETELPFPAPLQLAVGSDADVVVHAAGRQIRVSTAGHLEVPLLLTVPLQAARTINLTLTPDSLPEWAVVEPTSYSLSVDLTLPARLSTKITAKPTYISAAKWVKLADATAAFQAQIDVTVNGPLGNGTVLAIQAPVGVRSLTLSQRTIKSGQQSRILDVVAKARPTPASNDFVFSIAASRQGAIDIQPTGPLYIRVAGPAPLRACIGWARHVERTDCRHAFTSTICGP